MVHIASCCFSVAILAQHKLDVSTKSGRLSKRLPLTSSSVKLQRVSPERASVRQWLRDAEQSLGIAAVRRTVLSDHIGGIMLHPSLSQILPSKRHSSPSATVALGMQQNRETTSEGGARKGVTATLATRVAGRMITNLQKLVIIARQGSSEDPFAEAETAKQFDDHLSIVDQTGLVEDFTCTRQSGLAVRVLPYQACEATTAELSHLRDAGRPTGTCRVRQTRTRRSRRISVHRDGCPYTVGVERPAGSFRRRKGPEGSRHIHLQRDGFHIFDGMRSSRSSLAI